MTTSKLLYICPCPICEQGLLRPRICTSDSTPPESVAAILCDECDAVWSTPSLQERILTQNEGEPACPRCKKSLWGTQTHWATLEEIYLLGWYNHVQVAVMETSDGD